MLHSTTTQTDPSRWLSRLTVESHNAWITKSLQQLCVGWEPTASSAPWLHASCGLFRIRRKVSIYLFWRLKPALRRLLSSADFLIRITCHSDRPPQRPQVDIMRMRDGSGLAKRGQAQATNDKALTPCAINLKHAPRFLSTRLAKT